MTDDFTQTRGAIAGLLKHSSAESFELIFIDNSSDESAQEFIFQLASEHRVRLIQVRESERSSFGSLGNLGASAAVGEFLLFSDGHNKALSQHLLSNLAATLADPTVGSVGVEHLWKSKQDASSTKSSSPHDTCSKTPLSPQLLCIRAEAFWEVGGMDERFEDQVVCAADLQYQLMRSSYCLAQLKTLDGQRNVTRKRGKVNGPELKRMTRSDLEQLSRKYGKDARGLLYLKELFAEFSHPQIAVAIVTRNYGRWLTRCLKSVLQAQARARIPLQVVVVDDCSTDETGLILEEHRKKFPNTFTLIRSRTSRGISAVKNTAIRRSVGQYVALLDADDEFQRDKLVRCVEVFKANPKTDFLTHDYLFIDEATGERFVPGDEWYGDWRPPGVWVFRAGRVLFNEQMVCGYEELEWSQRFWRKLDRIHMPETLAIVHGQQTSDRWKVDRKVAGEQGMSRWRDGAKKKRAPLVFACRSCGCQYFKAAICCGQKTEVVSLVCYTTIASFPNHSPVEFSIVVFAADDLKATRSLCENLRTHFAGEEVELIFVHCHARRALLKYFRQLAGTMRVKAIFAPRPQPFVYGHDVNRALRAADGKYVLLLDSRAQVAATNLLPTLRQALNDLRVGMVGISPNQGAACCLTRAEKMAAAYHFTKGPLERFAWAMRQDVFWELGAMDERFEGDEMETLDLQYRALKEHYRLASFRGASLTLPPAARSNSQDRRDLALFKQKHLCRLRRTKGKVEPFASHCRAEISVALSTRNEALALAPCLDSILQSAKQSGLHFQIVVVNDCSTDETRLILEKYRQRFPDNFTVIHHERRRGLAYARNLALARAVGDYIACIDACAEFSGEKLKVCWKKLKETEADFLSHDWARASARMNQNRRSSQKRDDTPHFSTWMFRNGAVRLNEQLLIGGGDEEWFKSHVLSLRTVYLPQPLTILRSLRQKK